MTLTLLDTEPQPFKRPTRQMMIVYRAAYKEATGRECAITWGRMGAMIIGAFELPDIDSGEIQFEYPEPATWKQEVDGFFKNDYARSQRFPFALFLKQFGQYAVVEVKKRTPRIAVSMWDTCEKCGRNFPKGGECKHTGDAYGQSS